jgi:hypothetical protein
MLTTYFAADMKDKPLEEWKPRNRVEMDAYRKRLVEIITAASVSIYVCVCLYIPI